MHGQIILSVSNLSITYWAFIFASFSMWYSCICGADVHIPPFSGKCSKGRSRILLCSQSGDGKAAWNFVRNVNGKKSGGDSWNNKESEFRSKKLQKYQQQFKPWHIMFLLKRAEDKTRIQLEEKRDFSFFYGGVWLW